MVTPKDWRVTGNADDWMRGQEKRLMHEERRTHVTVAADIMGPGLGPNAVEITDWSGVETQFNGFYLSAPGTAVHSPDDTKWWLGQTVAQTDGYGYQTVWDYRGSSSPITVYSRKFSTTGAGTRIFSPWSVSGGSSGGGGSAVTSVAGRTGDVVLAAGDVASGVFSIARMPTGTTGTTVSFGDHTHDARYYTETEVDTAISTAIATHNHDSRYYTESEVDAALAGKAATVHTHTKSQITDFTHTHAGADITTGTVDIARLPTGTTATTVALGNHTHTGVYEPAFGAGTTAQYLRGDKTWQTLDKTAVGLSAVDNTSDASKPVSTAQATAIGLKLDASQKGASNGVAPLDTSTPTAKVPIANLPTAPSGSVSTVQVVRADDLRLADARTPLSHTHAAADVVSGIVDLARLGTTPAASTFLKAGGTTGSAAWSTLARGDVGLGNVDNTADTAKPVSTAQQTALNGKEPSIAAGTTAQYWRGDKTWQDLATAIGGEPPITAGTTSQYWRGDKTWQTLDKTAVGLGNVDNTSDANKPVSTAQATADSAARTGAFNDVNANIARGKADIVISTANTSTNLNQNFGAALPAVPTVVIGLYVTSAIGRGCNASGASASSFTASGYAGSAITLSCNWVALRIGV